ncbi:Uncharacterised protein g7105 [Pycnogonum litorale]
MKQKLTAIAEFSTTVDHCKSSAEPCEYGIDVSNNMYYYQLVTAIKKCIRSKKCSPVEVDPNNSLKLQDEMPPN